MGRGDCFSYPVEFGRVVQMAQAATVCAAEALHRGQRLSNALGDAAFQVLPSIDDEDRHQSRIWKKVIDVPSSGGVHAFQDPQVPCYSLQAAGPSGGAGVGVVASQERKRAEAADLDLPGQPKVQKEGIDPWPSVFGARLLGIIAFLRHEYESLVDGYLSLLLTGKPYEIYIMERIF